MKTCYFHQMTSFLGIAWLIPNKFKKNNKTTLLNQTNCRISELEILRVKEFTLQLLTTVNCALSISRVYINVNYTTQNSFPTKEGQWIIMFVLQKYFSAVYHPMSYLHGLVFLLTQSMHHCLETALLKASRLSKNEI